ncbi:MAG TPA: SLC13 family permease [Gammaproteobacteria bacterium]|jgi:di/tricarboxylate transporter|nr:SLC13 family permease [Gammaproteobacteria bacterium]
MELTIDQIVLFLLIVGVFALLLWGRVRYDIVAFAALIITIITGVIPVEQAFAGFGHPATVIIALVLVVSRGLSNSGAVEFIARFVVSGSRTITMHIGLMSGVGAALSALMNNVAALALLMPVDGEAAKRADRSPALTLMPLSFATILGGMVTLIGTPPNIVVATFRNDALGEPFRMFDFAAVGGVVAIVGVVFVALFGWRLLPAELVKRDARKELQDLAGYVSEAIVLQGSNIVGESLREVFPLAEDHDVAILGLVRNGRRLPGSARREKVSVGDFVVMEGAATAMETFIGTAGLEFAGTDQNIEMLGESQSLAEVVVPEGARIEGRSAMDMRLAYRQGVMLLGVLRQGTPFRDRVRKLPLRAGDVLLLSGPEDRLPDVVMWLGCLPLADRGLRLLQRKKTWLAIGFFGLAILAASTGVVYLPVALGAAAVLYVLFGLVRPAELYESVEWPIIILLGSMIPIGAAFESSGGAALIAQLIVDGTEGFPVFVVLLTLMVVTMTLSDVLNNVATALIAAPIAVDIAFSLGVSPDPFLMAVAVAASCAFLTPIGHKNNTIILGPGGYRFGDYWRMGLPLEILVVVVALPMILLVWPLY